MVLIQTKYSACSSEVEAWAAWAEWMTCLVECLEAEAVVEEEGHVEDLNSLVDSQEASLSLQDQVDSVVFLALPEAEEAVAVTLSQDSVCE